MIVLMWFLMVSLIVLVGLVFVAVVFRHYWKESQRKSSVENPAGIVE